MPSYKPTHIPHGLANSSKRTIRNPGIKDEAEFLKYGLETGGEYFEVRTLVKPGGGVPLHSHGSYGEEFYPDIGTLGVVGENGTKTMLLEKGQTYRIKPGEWHRFFNPSDTEDIIWSARVYPAHQGFEKVLYIYYGLAEEGHCDAAGAPTSMYYALMLMNMGEVSYPGFVMFFLGFAAVLVGWWARISGEEERLTRKYYGVPITDDNRGEADNYMKKEL